MVPRKFRGYTTDLEVNRWIYGYLTDYNKIGHHIPLETIQTELTVAIDSIGQFTGMYDSFGKEIFEGDIIRQTVGDIYTDFLVVYNNREGKFQKQFGDKNGKISLSDFSWTDFEHSELKVIDNIYDYGKRLKERLQEG